jgi:hypothetical protein
MRITKLIITALVVTGLTAATMPALAAKGGTVRVPLAAATSLTELSEAEIATLKWMREEEKLARDVYIELNAFWPAQIFVNIAESEQRHFDALGEKLELYGIDDPATDQIGVFTDPELQALHDELLALGVVSRVDALEVGVTIEETDMIDLQAAIDGTTSVPLRVTYENLLRGSEHHLASFIKELEAAGIVYEP